MVRFLAYALVGLGVLASSCGSESDQDQIKGTVQDYINATADGNGEDACDEFTGPAKRELIELAQAAVDTVECEEAVETLAGLLGDEEKDQLKNAVSDEADIRVTVKGDRARVQIRGATQAPLLVKIDGDWKINTLGFEGAKTAIDCIRDAGVGRVEEIDPGFPPTGVDAILGGSDEAVEILAGGTIRAVVVSYSDPGAAQDNLTAAQSAIPSDFIRDPAEQIEAYGNSIVIKYRDGPETDAAVKCARDPGI